MNERKAPLGENCAYANCVKLDNLIASKNIEINSSNESIVLIKSS